MFDKIILFSPHNRVVVSDSAVIMMGGGVWRATALPIDAFPNLNRPWPRTDHPVERLARHRDHRA